MNITIKFTGPQGSGQTELANKVYEFLKAEGFNLIKNEVGDENKKDMIVVLNPSLKFKEQV